MDKCTIPGALVHMELALSTVEGSPCSLQPETVHSSPLTLTGHGCFRSLGYNQCHH